MSPGKTGQENRPEATPEELQQAGGDPASGNS
jgi:hypothetical protein